MATHESDVHAPQLRDLIARASSGNDLSAEEAEAAFGAVMAGRATAVQMAALLVALRTKGEAPSEVAGGVRALRHAMIPVEAAAQPPLVDTCGTGGGVSTFNISTAAAVLAAGAGARIAKHGNRSFSSRSGSADVLEALGVRIELTPEGMAEVLHRTGIVFMFAPLLHPAMRHVAPVRGELALSTIMNLLGPLTNPAGARRQVVGVPEPARLELIAGALRELGHERALVVYGEPGLDELSPVGPTAVVELADGALRRYTLDPGRFGMSGLDAGELVGGSPADNARIVLDVLAGKRRGAARAAVVLNAGAALFVAGLEESLEKAVARAEAALEEGAGLEKLDALREATRSSEAR